MKVAAVQLCSGIDREANVAVVSDLIRQAAREGASLVATPEMTNVVDRKAERLLSHLPEEDGLTEIATFSELAKELGISLLIGSMAVAKSPAAPTQKMANRAYLFGAEGLVGTYDKIHLFDVHLPTGESWAESNRFDGGKERVVAHTPAGKLGLSICYDVRFPQHYRALAQAGAEILAVPSAFTVPTGKAHWATLLRSRAIETGSFLIAPAQGGTHEDGRVTYGHSMIVDPWGRVIAEKPDDQPGLLLADIDLGLVADTRARIPSLALECDAEVRILGE